MLFREIIAVYCEKHTEHTDTLCGQNAEILNVNVGGTYTNHCDFKQRALNHLFHTSYILSCNFCNI
jgi:hypothetical protein